MSVNVIINQKKKFLKKNIDIVTINDLWLKSCIN